MINQEFMEQFLSQNPPCVHCGKKECITAGVFQPTDSTEYGGIPEKQRLLVYALCKKCDKLSKNLDFRIKIEEKLKKNIEKNKIILH